MKRKLQAQSRLIPKLQSQAKEAEERSQQLKQQLRQRDLELGELREQLSKAGPSRDVGASVWAMHPEDSRWYRAKIESVSADGAALTLIFTDGVHTNLRGDLTRGKLDVSNQREDLAATNLCQGTKRSVHGATLAGTNVRVR